MKVLKRERRYHQQPGPRPEPVARAKPSHHVLGDRPRQRLATDRLPLGDLVEMVAKPIARVIDRVTSDLSPRIATHLAGCTACSVRRKFLNAVVGNVRSWRAWRRAPGLAWAAWKAFRPAAKRPRRAA